MPLRAIARLIQTMLYAKRFFPYYVYNILGGIEEDGMACLCPLNPPHACHSSLPQSDQYFNLQGQALYTPLTL